MPTIIGAGDPTTGYDVENSLRFNLVDDTDLVQTFGSAGNRRTWTFSAWIKRGRTAVRQQIFHQYGATDNNQWVEFRFDSDDKLTFSWYSSGVFTTSQVFRDIASWYHIVLAVDTTQGTDSDRIKLYVNGSQVTSFGSITYPSQNYDTGMNQATAHSLGHLENNGNFNFDGYMAEVNLVDGTQLTPTSFGETNDNGVWVPIKPTGINYGTNGYYLEFQNRASYTIPTARFSNDSDTQLLINSGAADGNTSFTDSSSNGISISANGNVHHESDVAKFSTSSIYFDGNGDYLEAADNSVYDFGTGDFTVEMWLYPTDLNDYDGIYFFGSGTNQHTLWLRADGNLRWAHIKAAGDGNTLDTTFNNTYLLENAWNHVAVVRESQVLRIAINGVITGQTQSTSGFSISLSGLKIGVEADNNRYYTGYMDCFRISDTARYTVSSSSNFGTDTSGNGKHFTSTNFAPHQQCVDVPTNNFFVMNSLGTIGTKNQQEINNILFSQQPEQLAITGFNSFRKAYERGLLKGSLGENLTRAFVHEMVRPIFGGIGGGAIGLYASDEDSDAPLTAGLMAGIALGIFNKRLENYKSQIVTKIPLRLRNAVVQESQKIFKRSFRTWAKTTLAGTHAAKLTSEANPVLNKFGEDLIGNRGNAFDFGKPLTNSIEEYKDTVLDYFRKQLYDITGELDDETLLAAGRIVQQSGIKNKIKYNFATQSDLNNLKAVEAANKILKLNKSIATYAKKAGLEFTELDNYGLTQILDNIQVDKITFEKAQKIIAKAFQIQNRNNIKKGIDTEELTDKNAMQRAASYLNNSDDVRRVEILKVEGKDVEKKVLQLLDTAKENVLKENKTLMQSARFIQNKRVLVDPEARAFAKQLFVQDPEFTTLRLIENTVPVAEFARRFGAQGQGISEVIKDIRKFYSSFGDINVNRSLQKLVNRDIKAVEDTVNAYFGVYRAGSYLNQNDFARSVALTLQTLLSTTKLTKVIIPSLGDLVQTINNSGFSAAANSALRQLRSTSKNPSAMLAQRNASIKEGILGRQWSNRTYNGTLQRELSDFSLQATNNYQKFLVNFQQKFFEAVQLGRMTRFAREFAYDAGAFRAFDLGQLAGKGKFPKKNIRELNSLGMSVDNAKYLSKFKSMDEAYADPIGKEIIDIAGRKAANRDALIPQIGNRRLFAQSKDPFIKFLGSFLSWAQAKSTQTNSLVRRIEDGDGKLAVMMLASMSLYGAVRQLQVSLNPVESVREDFPNPFEDEKELKKFLAETVVFSGQVIPWYIDKAVNFAKYNKRDAIETLYPAVGLVNDFFAVAPDAIPALGKVAGVSEGKPFSTLVKLAEAVVPFGKDLTRRKVIGEIFGLDESLKDAAEFADKEQSFRATYTTGGLIKGEYEVPNTKENPAQRINPYTGEPYYGLLLDDLPFFNIDTRQTFNEGGPPEEKNGLSEKERERLTLQAQELMKLDPPLKQTAPVIELLVAGVPKIIYGVGKTGYDLITTLAKESIKKPKPINYYHGSNLKLKEVTPMGDRATAPDVKDLFQQASYIGKPTEGGLELANFYARGAGYVNVIGKKQFDEVVKKLYNPRDVSDELKDKVMKEISMRQAFITKAKTERVNRNKLARARKEIIDLETLIKPFGSGYISRITPVQRKFLEREGFDGVDVSQDVVAIFRSVPVKSSIRGSLTQRLVDRRNAQQSKINE